MVEECCIISLGHPPSREWIVTQQPIFKLKLRGQKWSVKRLEMKTASNGRCAQNMKIYIWGLKWRKPPIQDNLKIWIVKYLINHWWNLSPNFKLNLAGEIWSVIRLNMKMTSKGRRPWNYENWNISANTGRIFPKISNLSWGDWSEVQMKRTFNGRQL